MQRSRWRQAACPTTTEEPLISLRGMCNLWSLYGVLGYMKDGNVYVELDDAS